VVIKIRYCQRRWKAIRFNYRVNERIRAKKLRVIDENGRQIGILPLKKALQLAYSKNLDLVEVAPHADPPVARIMDYGKFKYEMRKKEKEARKRPRILEMKEIHLRPGTEQHDLEVKMKKARELLERGHKVKIRVRYRGRERAYIKNGRQQLSGWVAPLLDLAKIERGPEISGFEVFAILTPDLAKLRKIWEEKQKHQKEGRQEDGKAEGENEEVSRQEVQGDG